MTTYEQALDYIHSFRKLGSKLGLEHIRELLERMGNPQKKLKFVHVAGTNGKGSTTAMTASILRRAGYRTGMFVSPFVIDFRERMQIDGEMITQDELVRQVERVRPIIEQMAGLPSEFEVVTALAMGYFAQEACEIVCLEVGLGGRYDPTNVIDCPLVSVITSISLDHMEYLGDSIEQIAAEKCGIIKQDGITVSYPEQNIDALGVIMAHCAQRQNKLVVGSVSGAQVDCVDLSGCSFSYDGLKIHVPLLGRHQIANAVTVIETLYQLRLEGFAISDEAIVSGIGAVRFPARMEILSRAPLVILDGAHNPDGARALHEAVSELPGAPKVVIFGMLRDKDFHNAAHEIAAMADCIFTVTPNTPRALDCRELAGEMRQICPDITPCDSMGDAYRLGCARAGDTGAVIICGSLYLASDMRRMILGGEEKSAAK